MIDVDVSNRAHPLFLFRLMKNREGRGELCDKSFASKQLSRTIKRNQRRYIRYET